MDNGDEIAFQSRAYLLLQKELFKLKQCGLWGVDVTIKDDNLFIWYVTMSGLKGTVWQGQKFTLSLKFSWFYNEEAPQVKFTRVPFHPNVDFQTGDICIDCLEKWEPSMKISDLLVAFQYMLSEPSLNKPINTEAAVMLMQSPEKYNQLVPEKINSLNVQGNEGDMPKEKKIVIERDETNTKNQKQACNRVSRLSYQDYYDSWKKIATCKSSKENANPLLDLFSGNMEQNFNAFLESDLEQEMQRQLSEHNMLMYGQFNSDKRKKERLKLNKTQLLKELGANQRGMKSLCVSVPTSPLEPEHKEDPMYYEDVDNEVSFLEMKDLIAWSQSLPDDI